MAKKKRKKVPEELKVQCQEYLEGWQRAKADYENLQKNILQSTQETQQRIKISFAQDLLPVMDNFTQALAHVPDLDGIDQAHRKSIQTWLEGVIYIKKQFEDVMQGIGAETIKTVGELFDENVHESVGTRFEENKKDQEILEEVQEGWKIGETVIRPAQVIINNFEN